MSVGFEASFDRLVITSRGFDTLREQVDTIANGLAHDLGDSAGMAGDDGAGNAFAKVYQPATGETVEQIAFAASVMGSTSAFEIPRNAGLGPVYRALTDHLVRVWTPLDSS